MRRTVLRSRRGIVLASVALLMLVAAVTAGLADAPGDEPIHIPGTAPMRMNEEAEMSFLERDFAFESRRTAGDQQLGGAEAAALHGRASGKADGDRSDSQREKSDRKHAGKPPVLPAFNGSWNAVGPDPINEFTRSGEGRFELMNGRIGALAIRKDGTFILGGAQGGIWIFDPSTGTWVPKTDQLGSLAIGALAVAPSNDKVVYAGTGEGALSGDSYFGNGVLKSKDGGKTWKHVSGDYFQGVSTTRIVVDPKDDDHLYAAVLRGRGGVRRVSPPEHSAYGLWESEDGGKKWKFLKKAPQDFGATDLEIDPWNGKILYASFWGDAIYKSTDGGKKWKQIMNGLPAADYAAEGTRFSISISHPAKNGPTTVYAGFGYAGEPAHVYKSGDGGANWAQLPDGTGDDSVLDYCAEQCVYDNVIEADPTNPNVVFAGGQFNYAIGSGGIFRSDDGGQSWKNLGWDQHPDYHALAFDPSNTSNVLVGSDGGVWFSDDRGGRPGAADPIENADWQTLNVGLQIGQFTSIATNPAWWDADPRGYPSRLWGGTQDNGTLRHSSTPSNATWTDLSSGDGGQVLVDPTDSNYVYGSYYGISPFRFDNGGAFLFSNESIRNGINPFDRSDFYAPWTLNKDNPNQLFYGTQRVYRTDNAKAPKAADVLWTPISGDLTSGCTDTAPNGARTCALSAFGVGGGDGVYAGSLDGLLWVSPDAQSAKTPSWTRVGQSSLPDRPVQSITVDRSNYRIAYVSYGGFNKATPGHAGHVFATADGGQTFKDISGNLPDSPVNSIILDPSFAGTIYAATDVGPYVTSDGGKKWWFMGGTSFPIVGIWQLDLDPSHGVLVAGTHGRGAFGIVDSTPRPALVVDKVDSGKPVGPGATIDYTLTVRNIGTGPATGVVLTDPIPANTTFASASDGGSLVSGAAKWTGISIPAGGSVSRTLHVTISDPLAGSVTSIVNDGIKAVSAEGPLTTGSPVATAIADPYAVSVAPASQTDGGKLGTSVTYHLDIRNGGFKSDSFALASSGGTFAVSFFEADCSTPITATATLASGATTDVCVSVDVPGGAANGDTSTASVTATSTGNPAVSAGSTVKTIAVNVDTLVVDQDGNVPPVESVYTSALTANGIAYSVWDLGADAKLPEHYLASFKNVVWFTANTYPAPLGAYEDELSVFLDGGGRLLMSGQDILDQAAGTTDFVYDYLHVEWDGSEAQNDKETANVNGVSSTLTDGIGAVPLDHSVLGANFEDQITPVGGAVSIFTDDSAETDALSYDGTYRVVFLAFPFEAYGDTAAKNDLMARTFAFFDAP